MPDTYHPSLEREDWREEEAPVVEQPQEAVVEQEALVTPPEAESTQEPQAAVEQEVQPQAVPEDSFIKINRANLYEELRKLADDPEMGDVVKTFAGRTAKRQKTDVLEARLKALEQENESLKFTQEMVTLRSEKGDEEIQRRLVDDPEFARKYHAKPEPVNVGEVEAAVAVRERIDEAIDYALTSGMPYQRVKQYREAIENGYFDFPRDAQGRVTGNMLDPTESLFRFNNAIRGEADYTRAQRVVAQPTPAAAPVAAATPAPEPVVERKPEANPALAMGGPDMSSSQGSSAGAMPMSEYVKLNGQERIERFPEGLPNAIAAGKVTRN